MPGLTVRLYEGPAGSAVPFSASDPNRSIGGASAVPGHTRGGPLEEKLIDTEALALDEEIAFRQSPVFDEPAGPPVPLPANLIEFPRQLVASLKARPRYAEGPLREESNVSSGAGQLRIFEVHPDQISTTPAAAEAIAPQWTSIWLDAPGGAPEANSGAGRDVDALHGAGVSIASPLHPASVDRRLMAAAINGLVVFAGFAASAVTFVLTCGATASHSDAQLGALSGQSGLRRLVSLAGQTGVQPTVALAASAIALGFLYLVYQALFFWFSEATPGMRCARIALCTFSDESPARPAMRRRILAVLLSAFPLGLGFVWAAFDEDRLAWHDRVCRMYQRRY
jgi:uncharacterized RDD family membrane protein YckC